MRPAFVFWIDRCLVYKVNKSTKISYFETLFIVQFIHDLGFFRVRFRQVSLHKPSQTILLIKNKITRERNFFTEFKPILQFWPNYIILWINMEPNKTLKSLKQNKYDNYLYIVHIACFRQYQNIQQTETRGSPEQTNLYLKMTIVHFSVNC